MSTAPTISIDAEFAKNLVKLYMAFKSQYPNEQSFATFMWWVKEQVVIL